MKKNLYTKIIYSLLLFVFGVPTAFASTISLVAPEEIHYNTPFTVHVGLDTNTATINSVEGEIQYDPALLQVRQVTTGSSLISLWVESPVVTKPGSIHFSGIIPGGVSVSNMNLFDIVFVSSDSGSRNISIASAHVLLNDGKGSEDIVVSKNLSFVVSATQGTEKDSSKDVVPPEKITAERTRNEYIYDNKWFVVFNTTDKGSGIARYEVCEFTRKNCVVAEHSYQLRNQTPLYRIIIRAYDNSGNFSEVVLFANTLKFILALFCVGLFTLFYKYTKKI